MVAVCSLGCTGAVTVAARLEGSVITSSWSRLFGESQNRIPQLVTDLHRRTLVAITFREEPRVSDSHANLSRSWEPGSLWPGVVSALKIARHHGKRRAGHEQADTRLELSDFPGGRARPLRKDEQDISRVFQELPANAQALAWATAPVE